MSSAFATVSDINTLWRTMTAEEQSRAEALLPIVTSSLCLEAKKVGKDLRTMVDEDEDLAEVAKSVTVDVVARTLMTATDQQPMTQFSESGFGYSQSGTFLVPGGGLFIKRSELARLGLKRQQIGAYMPYERDYSDPL